MVANRIRPVAGDALGYHWSSGTVTTGAWPDPSGAIRQMSVPRLAPRRNSSPPPPGSHDGCVEFEPAGVSVSRRGEAPSAPIVHTS